MYLYSDYKRIPNTNSFKQEVGDCVTEKTAQTHSFEKGPGGKIKIKTDYGTTMFICGLF